MQIGRKIYYEKLTGNVIVELGERAGGVIETTKEQDFSMYAALQAYVPEATECIQLEYGQYSDKFGYYYYSIDKDTGEIVWGDLINPGVPTPQPSIEERLAMLETQNTELKEQNLILMDALATVYEAVITT